MRTTCLYLDGIVLSVEFLWINFTFQVSHHTAEKDAAETLFWNLGNESFS